MPIIFYGGYNLIFFSRQKSFDHAYENMLGYIVTFQPFNSILDDLGAIWV
jgi:hypothetical protein